MLQDRSGLLHKVGSTMKGFSSKTLAAQLNELQKNKITGRKAFNEIPRGLIVVIGDILQPLYCYLVTE